MAVGPYQHLQKVETDRTPLPAEILPGREAMVRDVARQVWNREQLMTAYNTVSGELMFYRCPNHDEYPIVFATLDVRRPGLDPTEDVLRHVRRGKMSLRRKFKIVEWSKTSKKSDAVHEQDREDEAQRNSMLDFVRWRQQHRGMGKHFRRTHLIDQNPLAASK